MHPYGLASEILGKKMTDKIIEQRYKERDVILAGNEFAYVQDMTKELDDSED